MNFANFAPLKHKEDKKIFAYKKISALPRTSPMFLSALKNTIISHHLRELCYRNTRNS